ncbi:MAG: hypothetical protein JNK15_24020 [Planctomycetes bacterium]|nr:hypothetical protein [Planctomycetota bacterium]
MFDEPPLHGVSVEVVELRQPLQVGDAFAHERQPLLAREQRFVDWKLLAIGTRHGATEFHGRHDDFGPAPIGFAFELAPADGPNVAPSMHWAYGWK